MQVNFERGICVFETLPVYPYRAEIVEEDTERNSANWDLSDMVKAAGKKTGSGRRKLPPLISKEELYKLFVIDNLTSKAIAELKGLKVNYVRTQLKLFSIKKDKAKKV